MSAIVKKKLGPDFPCPFCYAQEQGMMVRRPSIRAWGKEHEPVCLFRELVQYAPRGVSLTEWQDYLVEVVRNIVEDAASRGISRSPTERAKYLIDAVAQARDVLPRFVRIVVFEDK